MTLPPGQYEVTDFPRFGLSQFAYRFPSEPRKIELKVLADAAEPATVSHEIERLPRREQTSDFHCVTTWTKRSLRWSGFRFSDFVDQIVVPRLRPQPDATFVILCCQDGYRVSLPLADLMADNVLLADRLNEEPLTIEHGAPLRLVAPAHYGYKNAKHVSAIEFRRDGHRYRPPAYRFMDHPRARVAYEERGRGAPGWLFRYLYRPLVKPTVRRFRRALAEHMPAVNG
jgi:DMSO/TMAO reductase YedYZ molybdopterin-dependent catalytic subunit